jgi:metal-responsive CopG/Arc/MetJ family transcriptional regulator
LARKELYPEGTETMNVTVPASLKERLDRVAGRDRQSRSQTVTRILEGWLDVNEPSPAVEPVGVA